jgi:polyphenol oxidase
MVMMESYMNLPAIPETFRWTSESWGPALRCRPLEAIAPHLFTTRQLALSSQGDWHRVAEAVGAERVQLLTQVHGREVVALRSGNPKGLPHNRPEADVLVSDDPTVAIAVRAADCVPILIADPQTGAVAAVHAGWRGTAAGASTAAVEALIREFGAQPADLVAAIGPSIGPCCYEVGSELVDAFATAGHARHLVDRWFVAPPSRRGEFPATPHGASGKLHLDTWGANRDQLLLAGLSEENIHVAELCTATNLDLLPSYRVEKERAGRIAGVIRARG